MEPDLGLVLAGLVVGFTVGLTGMGGGALMTPILVLLFGVHPLAAVSSDLVASFVMKPVGGMVHVRRGNANLRLAAWLCAGSVPSAFAGVLVLRSLGDDVGHLLEVFLGIALVLAASTILAKSALARRRGSADQTIDVGSVAVRPVPTLVIGVLGGMVVGITSVGSGSLMIVLLLVLYPRLTASGLVGTDLIQAVPLVGSAALGHLLFGDFQMDIAGWLLVGAVPAVYVGARCSASAPDHVIRPVLVVVLAASGLKLLGVPAELIGVGLVVVLAAASARFVVARQRAASEAEPEPDPFEPGRVPSPVREG